MVACQSNINKVIVPAAIYLEKVKLGVIYVSWKIPICLPPPLRFQSDVIVGTFDPETTALNGNKTGQKVDLPSVFTPRRTDCGLARRALPPRRST